MLKVYFRHYISHIWNKYKQKKDEKINFLTSICLVFTLNFSYAQTIDVVTGLSGPTAISLNGTDLYIAERDGNKVSKVDLSTLSTDDLSYQQEMLLSPNPSIDYIQLFGLTETVNYRIYNVFGTEVINGTISDNEKIDTQDITNGLYFVKFDNGNSVKFIKR